MRGRVLAPRQSQWRVREKIRGQTLGFFLKKLAQKQLLGTSELSRWEPFGLFVVSAGCDGS